MRMPLDAVDAHMGQLIRSQRLAKKISQRKLASQIGVTFQQVQKYENGSNRISASKLVEIAEALEMDVRTFFDGLAPERSLANDNNPPNEDLQRSHEGMLLNAAFLSIEDAAVRKKVLSLVQEIAREHAGQTTN